MDNKEADSEKPYKFLKEINLSETKIEVEPSGFKDLDDYVVLKRNTYELITLAALPGIGKSQLALQIAGVVSETKTVAYFSTEMSANILKSRLCAARSRIPLRDILTHNLGDKQLAFEDAIKDLDRLKLAVIDDFPKDIKSVFEIAKGMGKLGLIVIDQMPQFKEYYKGYDGINELTASFKTLAQKKKCPVIMVAQLNRGMQNRKYTSGASVKPMYSDLKGSSSIEQDSDIVMFITADRDHNPTTAHIHVTKNKNGRTGDFDLQWYGDFVQFQTKQTVQKGEL